MIRVWKGCNCIICSPSCGWLGPVAHCCCPASHENVVPCITSVVKDQNSKFKVWFLLNAYCFCTVVKSKSCQLNHGKSGTICIALGVIVNLDLVSDGPRNVWVFTIFHGVDTQVNVYWSLWGKDWGSLYGIYFPCCYRLLHPGVPPTSSENFQIWKLALQGIMTFDWSNWPPPPPDSSSFLLLIAYIKQSPCRCPSTLPLGTPCSVLSTGRIPWLSPQLCQSLW